MARKDVRLMIEEAARGGVELTRAFTRDGNGAIVAGSAAVIAAGIFWWGLPHMRRELESAR
jgi:hypothetical protein